MDRIEEIRKRVEAATPGPWVPSDHDWGSNDGVYVPEPNEGVCTVHNHGVRSWSCFVAVPANNHACEIGSEAHRNMVFIAHAREDIPFLLSELAKLQAENATLRRQVEAVTQAIQDHAESGNIENYPYLSDKIEAIGKRESS